MEKKSNFYSWDEYQLKNGRVDNTVVKLKAKKIYRHVSRGQEYVTSF